MLLKPKQYGKPDPAVIDEAMILAAVADADQLALEYDEVIPKPSLTIPEITRLSLSFKSLYTSANLGCLDSLVELRLDNNAITKIEHLGHLSNLTWLDLSFNEITVIEGLELLTKLTDLSLFNNKISEITGLSELKAVDCLSLGNNLIKTFAGLAPLRPMKHVKSLNLIGNPVCTHHDYRSYCISFFKNLVYLDYALVEAAEVQAAREASAQAEELVEANEKEQIEAATQEQEQLRKEVLSVLQNANIAVAETLFDDIMKDDSEISRLRLLPGVLHVLDEYRECFREVAEEFKARAIVANTAITSDHAAFTSATVDEAARSSAQAISEIAVYSRQRKHELRKFESGEIGNLTSLKCSAEGLYSNLLGIEMSTSERIEEMLELFETGLNELRLAKLAVHQLFFRAMEAYEGKCHEALMAVAEQLLKMSTEDPTAFDHLPDDLSALARDRELLLASISGSHDQRVSTIIGKEDAVIAAENKRCALLAKEPRLQERKRNRDRVVEIQAMFIAHKKEISDSELSMEDEEED